jgi:hypothetical protein
VMERNYEPFGNSRLPKLINSEVQVRSVVNQSFGIETKGNLVRLRYRPSWSSVKVDGRDTVIESARDSEPAPARTRVSCRS